MSTPPVALTIAGSDPGGGAGIQADLTTMAALGVHGTSVLTVVTAQNTTGVQALHALPRNVVEDQLVSVLADLPPRAAKCGLLGTTEVVRAVADAVERRVLPRPVVDPVMVAAGGDSLTSERDLDIARAYVDRLLPLSRLITPNTEEAAALLGGGAVETLPDRRAAAMSLLALGPEAVVVTGGRQDGACVDVYADADGLLEWTAPAVPTRNDHGTGCTFSAAVAAGVAHGASTREAAERARDFVRRRLSIGRDWRLGSGHGPVPHTAS